MSQLEYDDSAFTFFGLAVLSVFAIPYTYSFFKNNVLRSDAAAKAGKFVPRTAIEAANVDKVKANEKSVRRVFSCSFFFKVIVLLASWFAIYMFLGRVGNMGEMKVFDPFEILNLEHGATDQEIKKAYRKLTLKWHPDKHGAETKAEAERMFMKIAKAHEALTDEAAKENLEKFGNPDGRQPMEVSLGLPTWLLMKENHNLVLVIYLVVLVIAIPLVVGTYYSNSKRYGEKMILNESYQVYAFLLNNLTMKHMPEVLALSGEFRQLPLRPEDEAPLERLKRSLIVNEQMVKKPCPNAAMLFKRWPQTEKINILLHAHMNRIDTDEYLTSELKKDLNTVLSKAPMLLDAMVEVAQSRKSLKLVHRIVDLSQFLVQASWVNSSPLQQLPNFTKTEIKHATSGKGALRSLEQFVEGLDSDTKQKGMANFSEAEVQEIRNVAEILPIMDFKVQAGVMNYEEEDGTVVFEEGAAQGDAITIYVELRYAKPTKDKNRRTVHAPYFPLLIDDSWQLSMTKMDNDFCIFSQKISEDKEVVRRKMIFPSKDFAPGVHSFDVYLKSFCYVGLDQKKTVKIELGAPGTIKGPETHPDDLAISQEPSLYDLMAGTEPDANSDFESDNEEEEEKKTEKTPTVVEDSDDDLVAVEHSDAPVDTK